MTLDKGIIRWRGKLHFQTYNPAKIMKYGILVHMVCESDTGYNSISSWLQSWFVASHIPRQLLQ
jgi:hypothetical protein